MRAVLTRVKHASVTIDGIHQVNFILIQIRTVDSSQRDTPLMRISGLACSTQQHNQNSNSQAHSSVTANIHTGIILTKVQNKHLYS